MKRYLVVLDYQVEEDNPPQMQSMQWLAIIDTAIDYYTQYSGLVKAGKAGACTIYEVDYDRTTGQMVSQQVLSHCFNKFKKIVRYNAEKKSVMV